MKDVHQCCAIFTDSSNRVQWVLNWLSMLFPMLLLNDLQVYYLLAQSQIGNDFLMFFIFLLLVFFLHDADWVWWLRNLSSMLHPMQLLLYLLFRCLVTMNKNDLYVSTSTQFLCFNSPNAVSVVLAFSASPSACPNISPFSVSVLRKWMKSKSVWSFVVHHWTHSRSDPEWYNSVTVVFTFSAWANGTRSSPRNSQPVCVLIERWSKRIEPFVCVPKKKQEGTHTWSWLISAVSDSLQWRWIESPFFQDSSLWKIKWKATLESLSQEQRQTFQFFACSGFVEKLFQHPKKKTLMGPFVPSEMMASARSTSCSTPCPIA